jgi:hypothetical protein
MLERFRELREQNLLDIAQLERELGDRSKEAKFIQEDGPEDGPENYQKYRYRVKERLNREIEKGRQLKNQIEYLEAQEEGAALLRKVWERLEYNRDLADLREEVRLFMRNRYKVFLKDKRGK